MSWFKKRVDFRKNNTFIFIWLVVVIILRNLFIELIYISK